MSAHYRGPMRAMAISPENTLVPEERPEPTPRDGEVLVDVIAAGVNRADLAQVSGSYPPPPGASDLPGLEVSGRRRDTGEQVVALLPGGGYAETVAVHPDLLLPVPYGMDPVDAAGVIEVCATVVSNLVIEAHLTAGETVLIHGASGGIGTAAVQIAHSLGARVLASVGSEDAAEQVRALGADRVWNRHETDLVEAVRAEGGADVILDVIGGPALRDNVRSLRPDGRLVIIGILGGPTGELPVGQLMVKRLRVIGTTLRSRDLAAKKQILDRTHDLVWPLLADGSVRIPIQARFDLAQAAQAHQVLARGGHLGKVVLRIEQ